METREQFFHQSVLVSVEAIWDWLIIASYLWFRLPRYEVSAFDHHRSCVFLLW
jgi:hypothetical protein